MDIYETRPQSKFSLEPFTERKPTLIERFIGRAAIVVLFFNVFNSGIEKFVVPWINFFYPCVVEVCRLGLEPLYDTHLRLTVILKTLTLAGQKFLEM